MVAASDRADGITDLPGVRLYQQFDDQQNVIFDTCYVETITADDAGLAFSYSVTVDAFTGLALTATEHVCYMAVAYATNLDHVQEICNVQDPILVGRKAAFGAIQAHCMNGSASGVNELDPITSLALHPIGADQLCITGVRDGELVIFDQTGRMVTSQVVRAENTIVQISALPPGAYILSHVSAGDRRAHKRFVVAR